MINVAGCPKHLAGKFLCIDLIRARYLEKWPEQKEWTVVLYVQLQWKLELHQTVLTMWQINGKALLETSKVFSLATWCIFLLPWWKLACLAMEGSELNKFLLSLNCQDSGPEEGRRWMSWGRERKFNLSGSQWPFPLLGSTCRQGKTPSFPGVISSHYWRTIRQS